MISAARTILVAALFTASLAFAQSSSDNAGKNPGVKKSDKTETPINEVEHGFFIGANGGYWAIINPPVTSGGKQGFSGGQAASVQMGFDIGERVSIALFVLGAANRNGSDYVGKSEHNGAPTASGDYSTFSVGALIKANLIGFADSQDVKRTWLYLRAGAGYTAYTPCSTNPATYSCIIPGAELLVFAGPGVEYHTKLRHFSIGLEADFLFMALNQAFGFQVVPTLRYAF